MTTDSYKLKATKHHIWQRLSAISILILAPIVFYNLIPAFIQSADAVIAIMELPFMKISCGVLINLIAYHCWLGIDMIISDYFKGKTLSQLSIANGLFMLILLVHGFVIIIY